MATVVLTRSDRPFSNGGSSVTLTIGIVLALWLALVFVFGSRGAFVQPAGTPPLPIFFAVTVPIVIALAMYRASSAFRHVVLNLDQRLAVGMQAWRFGGLGFLALATYNVLPGVFAWPAGLGDIAIGATAPVLALAIARHPQVVTSRLFVFGTCSAFSISSSPSASARSSRGSGSARTTRASAPWPNCHSCSSRPFWCRAS